MWRNETDMQAMHVWVVVVVVSCFCHIRICQYTEADMLAWLGGGGLSFLRENLSSLF